MTAMGSMSSPYPDQRILTLGQSPAQDRGSFLTSASNRQAVDWIDAWPKWPAHALALYGPPASGKTHLAKIWSEQAQAITMTPDTLSEQFLADIARLPVNVVVESAETCAGRKAIEQVLFHLYNTLKEQRRFLLIVSRAAPVRWNIALPDLASRLGSIPSVAIEEPDDALLTTLLAKLFSDRQLVAPSEVLAYLIPRMQRSFAAAEKIAADLDNLSLAHQRPLTVALARMALEEKT